MRGQAKSSQALPVFFYSTFSSEAVVKALDKINRNEKHIFAYKSNSSLRFARFSHMCSWFVFKIADGPDKSEFSGIH